MADEESSPTLVELEALLSSGTPEDQRRGLELCRTTPLPDRFVETVLFERFGLTLDHHIDVPAVEDRANRTLQALYRDLTGDYSWLSREEIDEFPFQGVFDERLPILPSMIGEFPRIETIDLPSSRLHVLSPRVGELSRLRRLRIRESQIRELPDVFDRLALLEQVDFSENRLEGLPPSIWSCHRLRSLKVRSNRLASLLPGIERIQALDELDLMANPLRSLPAGLARVPTLRSLNIGWTDIPLDRAALGVLRELPRLERLNLGGLYLRSFPRELCELHSLRIVSVEDNHIEAFPEEIAQLTRLEKLVVKMNPIADEDRERLQALLPRVSIIQGASGFDEDVIGLVRSFD
jgi:hypothetical protein